MIDSSARTIALAAATLFLGACEPSTPSKAKGDDASKAKAAEPPPAAKAPPMMQPEPGKMACFGANACSAQGQCNVPDGRVAPGSKGHACAGLNECAGKGWLSLTQAECDAKGGKPL